MNGEPYHVKTFLLYGQLMDDGAIHVAPVHQEFAQALEVHLNEESKQGYLLQSVSGIDVTENYTVVVVTTERSARYAAVLDTSESDPAQS